MSRRLARGKWAPAVFEENEVIEEMQEATNGDKIYADLVEAILGLVYMNSDYETAVAVADELCVTIPWSETQYAEGHNGKPSKRAINTVKTVTGYERFNAPGLIEEAFTDHSAIRSKVPSYQRLEWIGDAVLCLSIREWVYNSFPDIPLGDMVVIETAVVCNETLAFLSVKNRLQQFLHHRDQCLPKKIDTYIQSVCEASHGLWGSSKYP